MEITVRRLTAENAAEARRLFALMTDVFSENSEPLGDAYLAGLLARRDFWVLAAWSGDEIVGGLTAHELPMTKAEATELLIYDVAVAHRHQRKGIGASLLRELFSLSGADSESFVLVDNADQHALDFYHKAGGRPSPVTLFSFSAK